MGFLQELVFQSHKQLIEIQQSGQRTSKQAKPYPSFTKPEVSHSMTKFFWQNLLDHDFKNRYKCEPDETLYTYVRIYADRGSEFGSKNRFGSSENDIFLNLTYNSNLHLS